jgi:hypothetical protein
VRAENDFGKNGKSVSTLIFYTDGVPEIIDRKKGGMPFVNGNRKQEV